MNLYQQYTLFEVPVYTKFLSACDIYTHEMFANRKHFSELVKAQI